MSDNGQSPRHVQDGSTFPTTPEEQPVPVDQGEPPVSSSWQTVSTPWGTPGNHLTGPIPRIRKRDDGSLTHDPQGEES